jgi:cysteine desulfurase
MKNIYLDHAAAAPLLPEAAAAMQRAYPEGFANTSAVHQWGQRAEYLLTEARNTAADLLGCRPNEIIFTGSGTESDNLAIRGVALARRKANGANHLLISTVEHPAVAATAKALADDFGFTVETVPVDRFGKCSPESIVERLRPNTALVSVIHANNEIGTINSIDTLAEPCRTRGIPFHTDAVQSAPWIPLKEVAEHVSALSIGGQKLGGPGLGILMVRKGTPIVPLITGGGQEFGVRSGTPHVPAIVGLVEALRHCTEKRSERVLHVSLLQRQIIEKTVGVIEGVELLGHITARTPNHVSLRVAGVESNTLARRLDLHGFAVSPGAACKTGNPAPSSVLLALGLSETAAREGLRITLGPQTTIAEVEAFLALFPTVVAEARKRSVAPKENP